MSTFRFAARAGAVLGALAEFNHTSIQFRARRRAGKGAPLPERESIPVLLVPGILGTTMVDPAHQNFPVWGNLRGSFFYRSKYDDLDLSILPGAKNRLQPGGILWKYTLASWLIYVPVYEDFKQSLLYAGYELGSLESPHSRRALYGLKYDWRCDIVTGARAVEKAVDMLRSSLGVNRVHLVGHSWGCLISRYYIRYGGADVLCDQPEEARPGASNVETFLAVGPPFGGTLRAFHSIQYGYAPGVSLGRPVAPHHVASSPAAYQLLRYDPDAVIDAGGADTRLDLSDVETWKKLRWGPYRKNSFEALYARGRAHNPDLNMKEMSTAVESFLSAALQRGRRLGEVMNKPAPQDKSVRTVTYTSNNRHTLHKLVLKRSEGSFHVLSSEKAVRKHFPALVDQTIAPGDEHVTFNDVLKHSGSRTIATDAHEIPKGSYVLVTDSRSHRGLFTRETVLTNLLLNVDRKIKS